MVSTPRGVYEYLVFRRYSAKSRGNGVCVGGWGGEGELDNILSLCAV